MKKLDKATLQRIKAVANELSRTAFVEHKRTLTAECMKLMEAGEDVEKYLTRAYLKAVAGDFEARFQRSTHPGAPARAEAMRT